MHDFGEHGWHIPPHTTAIKDAKAHTAVGSSLWSLLEDKQSIQARCGVRGTEEHDVVQRSCAGRLPIANRELPHHCQL